MNVLLIDWNSYGNKSMEALFRRRGYEVIKLPYEEKGPAQLRKARAEDFVRCLQTQRPDYVFSFNYFPVLSDCCQELKVPYFAWVYDSPFLDIYSYTVLNDVNRIFLFDGGVAAQFALNGIPTVHHLPLGIDADRYEKMTGAPENETEKKADICFVGSLYSEAKHRLYDKFAGISPYAKGYLDAAIEAQKSLYGVNLLEQMITPEIEEELQKVYPTDPDASTVMTPTQIYSQFVLSRRVTELERREVLELLGQMPCGERFLYTSEKDARVEGWRNLGPVDYYEKMPSVFASSKINLNITLRSILTGIPLRALDILGCNGFLLSNYQQELAERFIPGEDFDYYSDYEELRTKAEYYLSHEREREEIRANGCRKVRTEHSLESRLSEMEQYL